jgi:hypothetical protein
LRRKIAGVSGNAKPINSKSLSIREQPSSHPRRPSNDQAQRTGRPSAQPVRESTSGLPSLPLARNEFSYLYLQGAHRQRLNLGAAPRLIAGPPLSPERFSRLLPQTSQ